MQKMEYDLHIKEKSLVKAVSREFVKHSKSQKHYNISKHVSLKQV